MNHVVNRYLSRYDIQLEQAKHSLMEPFTTLNPFAQTLRKAEKFSEIVGLPPPLYVPIAEADAVNLVEAATVAYDHRDERLRGLEARLVDTQQQIEILENYTALDIDLHALGGLEFIHFRFGRFSVDNFRRFEKFLQSDMRVMFTVAKREKDFVYGVFFTPVMHEEEVDAIFSSLEWEDMGLHFGKQGDNPLVFAEQTLESRPPVFGDSTTPAAVIQRLRVEVFEMERAIAELTHGSFSSVCSAERLAVACAKVKQLYAAFDVKKFAAISRGRQVFTFSGWISDTDADALEREIEIDTLVLFTRNTHEGETRPPTLLRNLPVIRQFEFFTKLYGLPEYGEIDPTPVLAITYTLLFGLMFGDIGHGAVLAIFGIVVQKKWHKNLGGIMQVIGISAAVFGILYGSVFGFEFEPIWLRPTTNISQTLLLSAALGAVLIAFSMLLNMYNSFRRGKIAELLFSANGISGLLFYSSMLWLMVRVIFQGRPVTSLVVVIAALPLVLICFKHPIENYFDGNGFLPKGGVLAFIGQTAIEIFETLLTYLTNTISFVRVGAFAVSHVGMMHVVLQLSQGAAGSQNWIILILGNLLVLAIEGLLVGIQVLRLDFYELFSRFYKGTGEPFKSSNFNRNEG